MFNSSPGEIQHRCEIKNKSLRHCCIDLSLNMSAEELFHFRKIKKIYNILEKNRVFFTDLLYMKDKLAILDSANPQQLQDLEFLVRSILTRNETINSSLKEELIQELQSQEDIQKLRDFTNSTTSNYEDLRQIFIDSKPNLITLLLGHFVNDD